MKYVYVFYDHGSGYMVVHTKLENVAKEIAAMCRVCDRYLLFTHKEILADMKEREGKEYDELFNDEKFDIPTEWEWSVRKIPLYTKFIPDEYNGLLGV